MLQMHSCSGTFGGIGSAIENSGRARFAKVLRYASIGLPWMILYSSRHTSPAQFTSSGGLAQKCNRVATFST